ncbi:MAG: NAD(P)/FAD-dependent oxidoreductase [Deltaproteobacteria bacterium]|nr:NAD(P)/FAD-dependent oxidoreductase [Deltaproteobacteria bacterium]
MKDVIVIGGGAGGVPTAIRASQLGAEVAIVEAHQFGGLCMNRACVPFGHMMIATHILGAVEFGQKMGLSFDNLSMDFAALKKRQDELIDFMRKGVTSTLKKNNIELIEGKGQLAGKGKVAVNGETMDCKTVILATGATWAKPDFPGGDLDGVINTDDLLKMDALPDRVLLFGRSPWLLEIAQFLNRFGSEAIVAIQDKAILPDESKTIHSRLRKVLKDQGIDVRREADITKVSEQKKGIQVDLTAKEGKETVSVDCILYIEREAALKDLGLPRVGLDENLEYIETDDRMETQAKGVYAIGDLTGPGARHYSHFSSEGGIVAAENAMGLTAAMNPHTFTRVLFTRPQVACVGLTPKAAKKAGYDTVVGAAPYGMNPFGMLMAENEGIVEVVAENKYGEILGVHFIGSNAAEMAGQAVLTIQLEATLEDLARASFPHPTLSESLSEAARNALGRHIYLP